MSELATLRTAKAALDEGLIAPEDFDTIKLAFLRAQQIKAGLDAGFIREEDYTKTKDAFLCALDFRVLNVNAPLAGANGAALANKQGPAPVAVKPPGLAAAPAPAAASAGPTPSSPAPVARTIASSQLPRTGSDKQPARAGSPVSSVAPSSSAFSAIPTDLPKTRINPALAGKKTKSMSGISVNEDCAALFNYIKTRSAHKWVTYRIDDAGAEVIIDQLGSLESTYDDFLSVMPENQCRYGIFDYKYQGSDRGPFNKLVFVNWAPDGAPVRNKMMYASTKDFMKGFLEGIGAELQATDLGEMSEQEMREKVFQSLTRK